MKVLQTIKKIEGNKKFKEWMNKYPGSYLSYAFCIIEGKTVGEWQIGYYNKETDKITTFMINEELTICPEEEVFKKNDMKVRRINLNKIKINLDDILIKVDELAKKKYTQEMITKKIVILQNLDEMGNIWNITNITKSFNTLNIKVNTENGKILSHDLTSIFSFRK
ncbi:MAG: hypothetical protein ABH824_01865 [Nanoarchaeota archaeon]